MKSIRKEVGTVAAMALTLLLIAPATAGAQEASAYPPEAESRTFATTDGGWTESDEFEPDPSLCALNPLVCPSVTNSFVPSGGAGGAEDGFIRTGFFGVADLQVDPLVGTARGIWTSPTFTYQGAQGQIPDRVGFVMARRSDVGALITAGAAPTYSVELQNMTAGGPPLTLIDEAPLGGADDWTPTLAVEVNPAQVIIGQEYQLRIISSFDAGVVSVLVGGDADYDNVLLAALRGFGPGDPGDPGDPGPPGPPGDDRGPGPGISGLAGNNATVRGSRIVVNIRCVPRVRGACRVTPIGLRDGRDSGPVTRKPSMNGLSGFRVGSGERRQVSLQIKPQFRQRVRRMAANRERMMFRQRVRGNGQLRESYRRLRLRLGGN